MSKPNKIVTGGIFDFDRTKSSLMPLTDAFINGEVVFVPLQEIPFICVVCNENTFCYVDPCKHAICQNCGDKLFKPEHKIDHHYDEYFFEDTLYKDIIWRSFDCPQCNKHIDTINIIIERQ